MEPIRISEIVSAVGGVLRKGNPNAEVTSVSTNSREIQPGALFVPIIGEKVDAHQFIPMALESGAEACLTQEPDESLKFLDGAVIQVEDTQKALQDFAAWYRGRFSIPVIGVTGSVGKSSTKEMIAAALSQGNRIHKTAWNYNSQIGLPLTVFGLDHTHEVAVIEMGMSNFGEMERLSAIARPTSAVMTNIGISHIEQLKTQENIRGEKLHIADTIGEGGVLYLNGDDPLLRPLRESYPKKITWYGTAEDCGYRAENIDTVKDCTRFDLHAPFGVHKVMIPALGIHNVSNALAAIAVAYDQGLSLDDIRCGLLTYEGLAMRQQIHELERLTVIDDSYNASPDSIKSGIGVLKAVKSAGKKIAVLADMRELGEHSAQAHFELGTYAAKNGVDAIVTVGKEAERIAEGALAERPDLFVKICAANDEAFAELEKILCDGDCVLIKGSRGMHTDEIVQKLLTKYQ